MYTNNNSGNNQISLHQIKIKSMTKSNQTNGRRRMSVFFCIL